MSTGWLNSHFLTSPFCHGTCPLRKPQVHVFFSKCTLDVDVFASTTEGKDVYPLIGQPPVNVQYIGCYLKRFPQENEKTVFKPHPCQFITKDNLCRIYSVRPITCRKFPYTTFLEKNGLIHAYYVDVPWSECEGYRAKRHIKRQWLSTWISDLA